MQKTTELSSGKTIVIHYQYNEILDKAYDIKVVSEQFK